jgi:glutathione synthase/RimK-type ligase-like ATP-grasp enzyme
VYFPASFEPEDVALRPPGGDRPWDHFLDRQWRVVAEFIEYRLAARGSCINDPIAARRAANKLIQAAAISRRGLRMPALTVTNDPMLLGQIAAAAPIVRKAISEAPSAAGTPLAQTSAVAADDLEGWDLPAAAPLAYQALIETPQEVRFYVVGEDVIAVAIDRDGSATDIRFQPDSSRTARLTVEYAQFDSRLVALVGDLGLSFAAVDALPAGDDLLILEINPNGTWRKYPPEVVSWIDAAFIALIERQLSS